MGHRGQTHCINGHEFTEANTYWSHRSTGRVQRRCRICTLADTKIHDSYKRRSSKRGTGRGRHGLDREYRSRLRVFLELDYWWRPLALFKHERGRTRC